VAWGVSALPHMSRQLPLLTPTGPHSAVGFGLLMGVLAIILFKVSKSW